MSLFLLLTYCVRVWACVCVYACICVYVYLYVQQCHCGDASRPCPYSWSLTYGGCVEGVDTSRNEVCVCVCVCETRTNAHTHTHRHARAHTHARTLLLACSFARTQVCSDVGRLSKVLPADLRFEVIVCTQVRTLHPQSPLKACSLLFERGSLCEF